MQNHPERTEPPPDIPTSMSEQDSVTRMATRATESHPTSTALSETPNNAKRSHEQLTVAKTERSLLTIVQNKKQPLSQSELSPELVLLQRERQITFSAGAEVESIVHPSDLRALLAAIPSFPAHAPQLASDATPHQYMSGCNRDLTMDWEE